MHTSLLTYEQHVDTCICCAYYSMRPGQRASEFRFGSSEFSRLWLQGCSSFDGTKKFVVYQVLDPEAPCASLVISWL